MVYTKQLTTYGKLYTVAEFKRICKSGGFTDYDGFGRAVKDNLMTESIYNRSKIKQIPNDATHVMWYNR